MNGEELGFQSSSSGGYDGDPESRLEVMLQDAIAFERTLPPPDVDRFISRLRDRIARSEQMALPTPRPDTRTLWWSLAAVLPLVATLVFTFSVWNAPHGDAASDRVVIQNLDVLENLEPLSNEEIKALDPEVLDLLQDWDRFEDLQFDLLGKS